MARTSSRHAVLLAGKPAAAAAGTKKAKKEDGAKHDSAPAKVADKPAAKPAAAKGKGSAIASMWSKAPAKKAKKPAAKQAAAPAPVKEKAVAVDAEAFMRLNHEVRHFPKGSFSHCSVRGQHCRAV